jgi:hypothetical protein
MRGTAVRREVSSDELLARVEQLELAVAALQRAGTGARDAADVTLLRAIADAVPDQPFHSRKPLAIAAVTPVLAAALEGADIQAPQELGTLLGRCAYRNVGGVVVERLGRDADGIMWRVRVAV